MASTERLVGGIVEGEGPITEAQLLDNDDYERRRDGVLRWAGGFKAERRVSVGPDFTLLFENRATVWLQVQEELRWIAHRTPRRIRAILADHNGLVAPAGQLRASLFMNASSPEHGGGCDEASSLSDLELTLQLGGRTYEARRLDDTARRLAAVTYVAFVPSPHNAQGPDRLVWRRPTAGVLTLSERTRRALLQELVVTPPHEPLPRRGRTHPALPSLQPA